MGALSGAQNIYIGQPLAWSQVVNGGSATSEVFDMQVLSAQIPRSLRIGVFTSAAAGGAIDVDFTVLKLQWSDVSGSGYVDVPGTVFGTDKDVNGNVSTLPLQAGMTKKVFGWLVDTKPSAHRYFKIVATVGSGTHGVQLFALVEAADMDQMVAPEDVAQGFSQLLVAPPFLTTH